MLSVKEVYNKIADHFDVSRQRIWGSVKQFLNSLEKNSHVLDLGCGNGKNMLYRKDLCIEGIDISSELIKVCKKKSLSVIEGSITELPFTNAQFDNMICIATYHHLDNDLDRQSALKEMSRCLKVNGTLLLTVWAIEQFEGSTFHFTKADELVPWTTKTGETFYRYYHIYKKGQLEEEIQRLCPEFRILKCEWELGNWYVILQNTLS